MSVKTLVLIQVTLQVVSAVIKKVLDEQKDCKNCCLNSTRQIEQSTPVIQIEKGTTQVVQIDSDDVGVFI